MSTSTTKSKSTSDTSHEPSRSQLNTSRGRTMSSCDDVKRENSERVDAFSNPIATVVPEDHTGISDSRNNETTSEEEHNSGEDHPKRDAASKKNKVGMNQMLALTKSTSNKRMPSINGESSPFAETENIRTAKELLNLKMSSIQEEEKNKKPDLQGERPLKMPRRSRVSRRGKPSAHVAYPSSVNKLPGNAQGDGESTLTEHRDFEQNVHRSGYHREHQYTDRHRDLEVTKMGPYGSDEGKIRIIDGLPSRIASHSPSIGTRRRPNIQLTEEIPLDGTHGDPGPARYFPDRDFSRERVRVASTVDRGPVTPGSNVLGAYYSNPDVHPAERGAHYSHASTPYERPRLYYPVSRKGFHYIPTRQSVQHGGHGMVEPRRGYPVPPPVLARGQPSYSESERRVLRPPTVEGDGRSRSYPVVDDFDHQTEPDNVRWDSAQRSKVLLDRDNEEYYRVIQPPSHEDGISRGPPLSQDAAQQGLHERVGQAPEAYPAESSISAPYQQYIDPRGSARLPYAEEEHLTTLDPSYIDEEAAYHYYLRDRGRMGPFPAERDWYWQNAKKAPSGFAGVHAPLGGHAYHSNGWKPERPGFDPIEDRYEVLPHPVGPREAPMVRPPMEGYRSDMNEDDPYYSSPGNEDEGQNSRVEHARDMRNRPSFEELPKGDDGDALNKSRKKRVAVNANNRPSTFCHVCRRPSFLVQMVTCTNIRKATCRKVICDRCFEDYSWDWAEATAQNSSWTCPHCRGECPDDAQCASYRKTNLRRRDKRRQLAAILKEKALLEEKLQSTTAS